MKKKVEYPPEVHILLEGVIKMEKNDSIIVRQIASELLKKWDETRPTKQL